MNILSLNVIFCIFVSAEVPRKIPAAEAMGSANYEMKQSVKPNGSTIPLPGDRKKISFGVKSKPTKENQESFGIKVARKPTATVTSPKVNGNHSGNGCSEGASTSNGDSEDADRIVLTIKDGKVYNGSLGNVKSPGKSTGPAGLVPYNDESGSSDEESSSKPNGIATSPLKRSASGGETAVPPKRPANGPTSSSEPVFDQRLNATVNVPGAYKPLDQESKFGKRENGPAKDRGSPVKRPASTNDSIFPLQINVPSSSTKVNATTSWQIMEQDAQVSPSVTSNASSTSVNSTGNGWQISGSEEARKMPLVPEAQCNGWKVTPLKGPRPNGNVNGNVNGNAGDDYANANGSGDATNYHKTMEADRPLSNGPTVSSTQPGNDNSTKVTQPAPQQNGDEGQPSLPAEPSSSKVKKAEDSLSLSSFTSLLSGCTGSTLDSDSSPYRKKDKKKKKKKKKHKKRHDEDESDGGKRNGETESQESSDESSENYVWVEKTKESIQNKEKPSNDGE